MIKLDAMPETMTKKQEAPIFYFKSSSDTYIVKCKMWYIVMMSFASLNISSFASKEVFLAYEYPATIISKFDVKNRIYICR